MSSQGWIKLHRKIKTHWIWKDPFYLQLWIDFLMRANHEGSRIPVGSNFVDIERGSFLTSQQNLAKEFRCSRKRIHTFLNLLKNDHMIGFEGNSKFTMITICNYDTYQDKGTAEEHQKNHTGTSKEQLEISTSTTKEQLGNTNKNVKNVNNDKNYNNVKNEKNFINEGRKESGADITQLWIECFARFPTLIEQKETKNLINQYGFEKVKYEFSESAINGGKSLRYIINKLEGLKNGYKIQETKKHIMSNGNTKESYPVKEGYIQRELGKDFSSVVISG